MKGEATRSFTFAPIFYVTTSTLPFFLPSLLSIYLSTSVSHHSVISFLYSYSLPSQHPSSLVHLSHAPEMDIAAEYLSQSEIRPFIGASLWVRPRERGNNGLTGSRLLEYQLSTPSQSIRLAPICRLVALWDVDWCYKRNMSPFQHPYALFSLSLLLLYLF